MPVSPEKSEIHEEVEGDDLLDETVAYGASESGDIVMDWEPAQDVEADVEPEVEAEGETEVEAAVEAEADEASSSDDDDNVSPRPRRRSRRTPVPKQRYTYHEMGGDPVREAVT